VWPEVNKSRKAKKKIRKKKRPVKKREKRTTKRRVDDGGGKKKGTAWSLKKEKKDKDLNRKPTSAIMGGK